MSGQGHTALDVLRDALQRRDEQERRGVWQTPTKEQAALALVEAALDAAETLRRHDHNKPTLMVETTYEEWARIRQHLDAALAAALRAVREGAS